MVSKLDKPSQQQNKRAPKEPPDHKSQRPAHAHIQKSHKCTKLKAGVSRATAS